MSCASMPTVRPTTSVASASRCNTQRKHCLMGLESQSGDGCASSSRVVRRGLVEGEVPRNVRIAAASRSCASVSRSLVGLRRPALQAASRSNSSRKYRPARQTRFDRPRPRRTIAALCRTTILRRTRVVEPLDSAARKTECAPALFGRSAVMHVTIVACHRSLRQLVVGHRTMSGGLAVGFDRWT